MNIIRKIDLRSKRDLYLLVLVDDFIISNNDSDGIKIFDYSLSLIKNIDLMKEMSVYFVFKNPSKNQIILYCYDNSSMIWVDVANFSYKIIPLNNIADKLFSPMYCWYDQYVIFSTYNYEYYLLDIDTQSFNRINSFALKEICPELNDLMSFRINNISDTFELKNGYIVNDSKDGSVLSIINTDKQIKINPPQFSYHDVIYTEDLVVFVGETNIQVINNLNEVVLLHPITNYQFLKAEVTVHEGELVLVVLSGGILRPKDSLLSLFSLNK